MTDIIALFETLTPEQRTATLAELTKIAKPVKQKKPNTSCAFTIGEIVHLTQSKHVPKKYWNADYEVLKIAAEHIHLKHPEGKTDLWPLIEECNKINVSEELKTLIAVAKDNLPPDSPSVIVVDNVEPTPQEQSTEEGVVPPQEPQEEVTVSDVVAKISSVNVKARFEALKSQFSVTIETHIRSDFDNSDSYLKKIAEILDVAQGDLIVECSESLGLFLIDADASGYIVAGVIDENGKLFAFGLQDLGMDELKLYELTPELIGKYAKVIN